MTEPQIMRGAEPFYFEGGDVGCLVSHGFTGTPQSMRFLGEFLANEGRLTVCGPRLKGHGTSVEDMARSSAEDWIRSVEAGLQKLRERCSRIFMTGLSMGGHPHQRRGVYQQPGPGRPGLYGRSARHRSRRRRRYQKAWRHRTGLPRCSGAGHPSDLCPDERHARAAAQGKLSDPGDPIAR
jgi:hypothetical protein